MVQASTLEISSIAVLNSSTLMMAGLVAYCVVQFTVVSQLLAHSGIIQFVAERVPTGIHLHVFVYTPSQAVPATQVAVAVVCCNVSIP